MSEVRRCRHFRVVNMQTGGIAFAASENRHGHEARLHAERWLTILGDGYRIEEWEQITPVVESTWRRIDPPEESSGNAEGES